jgi:hypothetical protein
MNYSYAVKGDGQIATVALSKNSQMDALKALVSCMEPQGLVISESIVKLIPPRPAGFDYTRELFNRRTGLLFDPLAAAETAADMPLSFLFNVNRLNRMVQFQVSNDGLGIDEMVNYLIDKTWKSSRLKGMEGLIQKQNEQLLLTYLLSTSVNEDASFASKAQILQVLDSLKSYASEQVKLTKDANEKAYFLLSLDRMKNPEKAKPTLHSIAPPGAPIGCMMEEF